MPNSPCSTCGGSVDAQTGVCPQCATQVASRPASLTAPATAPAISAGTDGPTETPEISGYRMIGRLGEGGMGAVYLAEETTLGRRVAVKVISSRMAPDAQSKARFLREARTLATIEHPHVVRVYSFGEVEGRPYLAMEYVEGETLTERIARSGKLSLDEALRVTRDVVDALDSAWESHVIHRDIKPSNILVDRRGRVRVADFGLAKPAEVSENDVALTQSGLMVGTPHYISPEQAQGRELDFRSDFYSLGIMLFHMLTGERPFQGSTPVAIVAKHLHEPMPNVRALRADLPPEIERLIVWMTAKDPSARPGSHRELLATLDSLITRTPTAPMPTFSTVAVPRSRPSIRNVLLALAAVVVVAVGIECYFWASKARRTPDTFTAPRGEFIVAVAPFYGPDEDSSKEGRVMAALIERAVAERLRGGNSRVAGIEETKTVVRSHDEARELGRKLNASAVIWGEAFALRTETEIRPYVTVVTQRKAEAAAGEKSDGDARLLSASRSRAMDSFSDTGATPVKLEAEAPNQIELRKTSASGIGDVVMLLAGIHALENESNNDKALALFRQAPRSAETLRYEVQALLRANRLEEARAALEESLKLDPNDAPSLALLGDLQLARNHVAEAVDAYRRAATTKQPYTTARGVFYDGKLYAKETYSHKFLNEGKQTETVSLLGIDPASQRVVERHSLPGVIAGFRIDGEDLVITYKAHKDDASARAELRFRHGTFDRLLWPPANLLWRTRSMRAGRVLAGNFLREIDTSRGFGEPGGRFVVTKDPSPDLPATLPDLERALREAARQDPTQPWHLFFLALTLRAENRMAEANAVFDQLTRGDWPGVPYFQFTWMMANLERLGYGAWVDQLYPKALAKRRELPEAVDFAVLIERLINEPFVRQAAANRNAARGYEALVRARAIGGVTPEGEDFVASAWAEHFERTGQGELASREREVARRTRENPFNFPAVNARLDYATAFLLSAVLTFVVVFSVILVLAVRRARRLGASPSARGPWREWVARVPRLGKVVFLALAGGIVAVSGIWLFAVGSAAPVATLVALVAVLFLLARVLKVTPMQVFGAISRRQRLLLVGLYGFFLVTLAVFLWRLAAMQVISATPIGLSDAIGHPHVLQLMEESARGNAPSAELSYVLAVAHHYGREAAAAEALYGRVPQDYARAKDNLAALKNGRPPVAPLSAGEVEAALTSSPFATIKQAIIERELPIPPLALLFGVPLLFLALFAVPPREAEAPGPPSLGAKLAMLIVPGSWDLRRGAVVRGAATVLLLTLPLLPVISFFIADVAAVGWSTSLSLPNLNSSFPMPGNAPDPMRAFKWTFLLNYPHASLFVGLIGASLALGLALHALAVVAIVREPRRVRDQAVRSNLASVST
jgi:tetratricopeptide (TPR) repeat protein/predicted Ser/Thr protein kinase